MTSSGARECAISTPWPDVRSTLGEGPCWCPRSGVLHWVDIRAGCVWRGRPGGRACRVLQFDEPVSAVVPVADGSLLVTGRLTIYHWDGRSSEAALLARLPDEADGNRCNEARSDPWGNLWIGTMDDAGRAASGALWCLARSGELEKAVDGMGIPNTLAWDPGRARMYLGDSAAGLLAAFDFDPASRRLAGQRTFLAAGAAPGVPDGSALDEEGFLWHARWDGACVVRIAPSGRLAGTVELPARRPTSCAFGEAGELFVTTALPDHASSARPGDGVVWRLQTPVKGEAAPAYAGPTRAGSIRVTCTAAPVRWRTS